MTRAAELFYAATVPTKEGEMRRKGPADLRWSDVTPRAMMLGRRAVLAGMAGGLLARAAAAEPGPGYPAEDALTDRESITTYNNFYEFGFGKGDPSRYAGALVVDPWAIQIGGLVDRPGNYDLADVLLGQKIEERIYRLRCVEAWSMVIPWLGFELSALLKRVGVQSGARYVAFETASQPQAMPGFNARGMDFPYVEGLRLDEAMHPLTILATGLYGDPMPRQNGAPIRLVVPWKYGFKSIKSIVRITLTAEAPPTTWQQLQPSEYGFFANVNPQVSHPRWSQASERRIGDGLFARRRETLMFNGYAEQVAGLYAGMDLAKHY